MINNGIKTADEHIIIESADKQKSLELTIEGYEFRDIADDTDSYDKNWLNVRIVGKKEGSTICNITDPCLLTWEMGRIYDTLDALLKGDLSEADSDELFLLTESTIFFNMRNADSGLYVLSITANGFNVRARLTQAEVRHLLKLLAQGMKTYPER